MAAPTSTQRRHRRSRRSRRRRRSGWSGLGSTLVGFAALTALIVWVDGTGSRSLSGRATVIDGDSLEINRNRIRLMGIDAPELRQLCRRDAKTWPCGRDSRSSLRQLVGNFDVQCQTHGEDQYRRLLAVCSVNGTEINARQVELGWATDFGGYAGEEGVARRDKAGIWSGRFEAPAEWRRANRSQSDAAPVNVLSWWKRLVSSF